MVIYHTTTIEQGDLEKELKARADDGYTIHSIMLFEGVWVVTDFKKQMMSFSKVHDPMDDFIHDPMDDPIHDPMDDPIRDPLENGP